MLASKSFLLGSAALVGASALVLTATAFGYGRGALPGTSGGAGSVPNDVTRRAASCGQCHSQHGGNNLKVMVELGKYSLSASEATTVRVRSTGGVNAPTNPPNWGGFCAEVTGGKFSTSSTVQIDASGAFATHNFAFNAQRDWQFGYTAGTTPGLVDLYAVVNTVNGNGRTSGDIWGFHGNDAGAMQNTPARLYVNAAGVRDIGRACVGSFGNRPVIGAKTSATVGNQNFGIEAHGAAPQTSAVMLLGVQLPNPLDLSVLGAPGCLLHVQSLATFNALTSAGNAQRGEGIATFPVPIPNDPGLSGGKFAVQVAIVDPASGRALPITMTNGLEVSIP